MKKIFFIILIICILILCYTFLFGKLFTYSPIIIGFDKHEQNQTIIYVQKGAEFNDYKRMDTLISSVENFHDLKFKKKPKIFIFKDSLSFIRRSFSKARFSAYPSGRLIVSPWALKEAEQGKISLEIYVKHELSHVIIFQHKGILAELNYPKWLLEGIATYSANQMGTSFYPSKEETYQAIVQGNFLPPFDFKTKREDQTQLNVPYRIPFMYSEFACIVDFLIEKNGKEKFLIYMKNLIYTNDHAKIFKEIYGCDFNEFIIQFRQYVELQNSLRVKESIKTIKI